MDEVKQTITETEKTGIDTSGASARQQTSRIQTETSVDASTTIQNIVWYILGFVEVLLGLRLVLKLFGANPESSFVDFIYSTTGVLIAPFESIFGVTSTTTGQTRSIFEPSVVVAILVYALIAWGVVKLVTINQRTE